MASYIGQTLGDTLNLLDRFGVIMPHVLIEAARQDKTTEHHAFGSVSHVVHNVWLHAENGPDDRYTLNECSDHDDDRGCCDTCGRWRNKPASDTWNRQTTAIVADQIMKGEAGT